MEIRQARQLARQLMDQHNLQSWHLEFSNRAVRRFGVCILKERVIRLSAKLVRLNEEARVRNTILHEIAHALTPKSGHNWIWQKKALEIGCDGKRCYDSSLVARPDAKYIGKCPSCPFTVERFRRKDGSCPKCSGGRYNANYKIIWSKA